VLLINRPKGAINYLDLVQLLLILSKLLRPTYCKTNSASNSVVMKENRVKSALFRAFPMAGHIII
jgi:hypothetical protein